MQHFFMLSIENYDLKIAGKTLLTNTTLSVAGGHRYGLIGRNGAGKSTLLADIAKRMKDINVYLVSQEVRDSEDAIYDSILKTHRKLWDLKTEMARLEDDCGDDGDGIEKYEECCQQWIVEGYEAVEKELFRILYHLGFNAADQRRSVNSFSGGWKMRISLASALFIKPDLLLLDEPTNHLDLEGNIWLIDYLEHWKSILIVVSHDVELLDNVCTDIIHLHNKELKYYSGNYSKFSKMFQQESTEATKAWVKYNKGLKALQKKGKAKSIIEDYIKHNKVEPPVVDKKAKIDLPDVSPIGTPVVEVINVSFQYGDNVLFSGANIGIDLDSRYTIVGRNGAGKSTFLKLLAGELLPTIGEVTRNRHLRVGYFHQHTGDVLPMEQNPVQYLQSVDVSLTEQRARQWLGKIGLEGKIHLNRIETLSGGQKARVSLIGVLLGKPHILLLDEPTNHLDMETIEILIEALNQYKGGLITITHDLNLIHGTDSILLHINNERISEIEYEEYHQLVLGI
jgi:ATP-binding cassette, subfamily F, member 1